MTSNDSKSKTVPNPIERLLALFAEVRPGEGTTALLMMLNVFLLLTAYYILKTVREPMILTGGMLGLSGEELKVYASAGQAFLLLGVVPLYGFLASEMTRIKLLNGSMVVFIGCLGGFNLLARLDLPLGLAFFLWLGIFNVFIIAQFWSYANDIYTEGQGKRLFAIIAVGGSVGAIAGPVVAKNASDDEFVLMLIAAAILAICTLLYNIVNRNEARRSVENGEDSEKGAGDPPLSKDGGFQLVLRQKYLLFIALMLLVSNVVNTTGEFILGKAANAYAAVEVPDDSFSKDLVTGVIDGDTRDARIRKARGTKVKNFYADFFQLVNLVSFLIQAFVVSRIFKYIGVRAALFVLPVVAFGGYALIGAVGGLLLIRVAKTAENSTDYSLQNTVRQALFLPTSREAKYKAKAAIDTFFVRIGDALAAGVVAFGIHVLSFSTRGFAFTNVALIGIWILLAVGIAREHKRLSVGAASSGR